MFCVVSSILSYYSARPDVEWEEVYGSCLIWRTKRIITYGGGPEGGYVCLFREHELGWYRWTRAWGSCPILGDDLGRPGGDEMARSRGAVGRSA